MGITRYCWTSSALSDVGLLRRINEDACLDLPGRGLWAVADGMGGHAYGEMASRMVVDALAGLARPPTMAEFVDAARRKLLAVNEALRLAAVEQDVAIIGSTIVALLAIERQCAVLWAGDSRAYLLHAGGFRQLTRDHSPGAELSEARETGAAANGVQIGSAVHAAGGAVGGAVGGTVGGAVGGAVGVGAGGTAGTTARGAAGDTASGTATRAASRASPGVATSMPTVPANGITRAVGAADQLTIDEIRFDVDDGDVLLLCSDGLSRQVSDAEIARTLMPGKIPNAAQALVALALQRGGRDNVSVIVVAVEDLWSADRTQLNPAC